MSKDALFRDAEQFSQELKHREELEAQRKKDLKDQLDLAKVEKGNREYEEAKQRRQQTTSQQNTETKNT